MISFKNVKNPVLGKHSRLWINAVRQRWNGTVLKIAAAAIGQDGAESSELCCQSWEHKSNSTCG